MEPWRTVALAVVLTIITWVVIGSAGKNIQDGLKMLAEEMRIFRDVLSAAPEILYSATFDPSTIVALTNIVITDTSDGYTDFSYRDSLLAQDWKIIRIAYEGDNLIITLIKEKNSQVEHAVSTETDTATTSQLA
jgi:hypothetical protein